MLGEPSKNDYWGKLRRTRTSEASIEAWHPLVAHAADVAACLSAFLGLRPEGFAPTLTNQRLARLGGRDALDLVQVSRLGVFAALHDLGKFNHGFQNKALKIPPFEAGHVGPALALLPCPLERLSFDPSETQCAFVRLFPQAMEGWQREDIGSLRLLLAVLAHHGEPGETGGESNPKLWRPSSDRDPFADLARLVAATRDWLPAAWQSDGEVLPDTSAFQHFFAGLTQLADWLGSDTRHFPFAETDDDRWPFAIRQAEKAVTEMGFEGAPTRLNMPPPTFAAIGAGRPARPAQAALGDLPLPKAGSSTVVLEDETGAGKTEAALFWFARLFQAGLIDGLYFALPTRTAATQIHRRVTEAVARLWPNEPRPRVVLAVPGYLRVDDEEGQRLPGFEVLWPDRQRDPARWAAEHPKRYLAASIAVGTVDQVLLSALATGHSHLRAACLARHLLVVDEVHASDVYMTAILESVLNRQRASGGHALLMSATLGAATRARLLGSSAPPSIEEALKTPYPHIVRDDGLPAKTISSWTRPRRIAIETQPLLDEPEAIADRAIERATAGARVLIVRNTVAGCLAVFEALEARAPDLLWRCAGIPAPHHARFAREDREALDVALEQAFGLNAPVGGRIVCATQTVQQALDLDADFLISDLCPSDVLLQRLGRLHRHRGRARPSGFEEPRALLLAPEVDLTTFLRSNGEARAPHGLGSVYPDLRALDATWRLAATGGVEIPTENRAWVEAIAHPAKLNQYKEGLWARHAEKVAGEAIAKRLIGESALANWKAPFGGEPSGRQGESFPRGDFARRILTRLGAEDRLVELPPGTLGPFGHPIRRLSIPAYWLCGVDGEAEPKVERLHAPKAIGQKSPLGIVFGIRHFRYDAKGLRPLESGSEDDAADI